jgi:leucyl-tRNA synthetase
VVLPDKVDYTPTGKPPLATALDWVRVVCPECGGAARREVETMDTYVDSSWYFFRYPSPNYKKGPFDEKVINKWMPIKLYFGGPEHILGHTLYARFVTKFLNALGIIKFNEFALKRYHHGVILGTDGYRMSKSRGNVVNPDEQVAKFGADSVRMYIAFLGPHDKGGAWKTEGVEGSYRFLNKVRSFVSEASDINLSKEDSKLVFNMMQRTIRKVTIDIERLQTNTAIASIMEYFNLLRAVASKSSTSANDLTEKKIFQNKNWYEALKILVQLLAPFAPHLAEEVWVNVLGEEFSVHKSSWPKYDPKLIVEENVTIAVQVNGKLRGTIIVQSANLPAGGQGAKVQSDMEEMAKKDPMVAKWLEGKEIKKVIFVPGRLLNFVI